MLSETSAIAPVLLSSCNHTVCLLYDKIVKKWLYVDTNDFERFPKLTSYTRELDSASLATSIFRSFISEKVSYTVFNTRIITKSSQNELFKKALDKLDKKYPIDSEHANRYDGYQAGLLYLACQNGHVGIVRELLQQGNIEINNVNNDGATPLLIACQNGHIEIVRELLQQDNIRINKADNNRVTPLYISCQNGHIEIVRELLQQKNIEVNTTNNNGVTPLYIGCQNGHVEIVRELLQQKNIEANTANNNGATPFLTACQNGHVDIVRELLQQKGIQINKANNNGATPLYIACQNGHTEIAKLLIKAGHPVDSIGLENHTPLLVACLSPHTHEKRELFELLLQHNASLTHSNNKGQTALDIALQNDNKAAIQAINNTNKIMRYFCANSLCTLDKYIEKYETALTIPQQEKNAMKILSSSLTQLIYSTDEVNRQLGRDIEAAVNEFYRGDSELDKKMAKNNLRKTIKKYETVASTKTALAIISNILMAVSILGMVVNTEIFFGSGETRVANVVETEVNTGFNDHNDFYNQDREMFESLLSLPVEFVNILQPEIEILLRPENQRTRKRPHQNELRPVSGYVQWPDTPDSTAQNKAQKITYQSINPMFFNSGIRKTSDVSEAEETDFSQDIGY